mmetsp:Transcript_4734/g.14047  ORF Transcript_4734/g.14047 Transcript_4734/m.14047 type:complete len:484 (+) Transcript_4734:105-1556(+)
MAPIPQAVGITLLAAVCLAAARAALNAWVCRPRKKDVTGRHDAKVVVVLGAQWGDEGKGKLVDVLAGRANIVARFNGGANAGHTLEVGGRKYAFHLLPCGMLRDSCENVIGNGVVVHLPTLFKELKQLDGGNDTSLARLRISSRAHVLLDAHRAIDGLLEAEKAGAAGGGAIGTTKRGIGPCYASKMNRNGLRFCDLVGPDSTLVARVTALRQFQAAHYSDVVPGAAVADDDAELVALRSYRDRLLRAGAVADTVTGIRARLGAGAVVLAEGANAALLDVDFGTYPYVTSSPTTAGGVCTGLGLPPSALDCVIGVVKAYTTRVGAGPFPTELEIDNTGPGKHFSDAGHEYGTTTGRRRRCGWLDIPLLRYSHMLNGYDSLNLTKLDVLTGLSTLKIGIEYVVDGQTLPHGYMPPGLDELAAVDVKYIELPGWTEDLTHCTSFSDLPANARRYIREIEARVGCPISWVGVGPGRDDIFVMPDVH